MVMRTSTLHTLPFPRSNRVWSSIRISCSECKYGTNPLYKINTNLERTQAPAASLSNQTKNAREVIREHDCAFIVSEVVLITGIRDLPVPNHPILQSLAVWKISSSCWISFALDAGSSGERVLGLTQLPRSFISNNLAAIYCRKKGC